MANERLYIECVRALIEAGIPRGRDEFEPDNLRSIRRDREKSAKKQIRNSLLNEKSDDAAKKYLDRCQRDLTQFFGSQQISEKKRKLILEAATSSLDFDEGDFEQDSPAARRKTNTEARQVMLKAIKSKRDELLK